ncbi:HesA/MoeB/ThiF family protein [Clostridium psychrophilum]|uniref:HesA/MoeB/ThiF family protein n=1 Tax=Clostridium psychrophilum TaxID=132926 RepID=UPI001C0CDDEA|nr:HesA/MoeB/ThiF family protein [Clostridium psychrophilum]MBU3181122.1 ThiF family adenylyltransferase [Clostridium psychrophilum]
MILSKNQINRYLRHIIIPEISGPGQKKILESKIYLYSSTVLEASSLIYYLAASGIGYIFCSFKDDQGFDELYNNIKDLNEDVVVTLTDKKIPIVRGNSLSIEGFEIRILISNYEDLQSMLMRFASSQTPSKFIPTILAINGGWKGILQTFCNEVDFNSLISNSLTLDSNPLRNKAYAKEGNILSHNLLGALTTVECVKLCLNIGTILDKPLCFDLLPMKFYKLDTKVINSTIIDFFKDNYSENHLSSYLKETNNTKNLSDSKVLIVGTGGLGSPVAFALACLGIGTIGLVDYDKVEISNLNRQILHSASRINMPKVDSAKVFIKNINPDVNVVTYNTDLNINNSKDIIKDYDVIIDGVDNFPARYLLNDTCFFLNKPLVDAAAVKLHGLIMTILPNEGPCYRCVFPVKPEQNNVMRCSEAGVLGPVPGVMGFIQAAEVVKLLMKVGETLYNRIIYYDALDSDFDYINTNKSPKCNLCGTHPTINTPVEYTNSCKL